MNDDQVVSKILKLLENNTAFIGYALNGGIGTKINVKNTETGKTIQALSVNVDSSGEVLIVKDSEDGKYKAVTFKSAESASSRIIQLRTTKPVDDKKIIDYTDADIEVFYLFVKLVETGSPYPTELQSTWIRKGSSCTQFVGAYERCNYASKETIGGTSYTGLPYITYPALQDCLNDDLGRDARSPHGGKDEQGLGAGYRVYSSRVTGENEELIQAAIMSHDETFGTNFAGGFGYGSILDCSGAMYIEGWQYANKPQTGEPYLHCDFGFIPGFTNECTLEMQAMGYCDSRGFVNSKTPPPGTPGVGSINNSWAYEYDWVNLPYSFMYKRHFQPLYVNGDFARGTFLILEVSGTQNPTIPDGLFLWTPGCPPLAQGPYDGSGGNRFPNGPSPPQKRDMKLSTHKAEIWLGSSKKTEAIKLYELGASDLFSGMYNAFILAANETELDINSRLRRDGTNTTLEDQLRHEKFYQNRNKNIIDLRIDPKVWIYIIDNIPQANYTTRPAVDIVPPTDPKNANLQQMIDNLYNRTLNLTVIDKKTQVIHLKLGLTPRNTLSNTDCKGTGNAPANDIISNQSWEYQKCVTIKVKNWVVEGINNSLDTSMLINNTWNKEYIEKKFFTSFGRSWSTAGTQIGGGNFDTTRDSANNILLRSNSSALLTDLISGNHYEQYNYSQAKSPDNFNLDLRIFPNSCSHIKKPISSTDAQQLVLRSTNSWWALWDRSILSSKDKRLSSIVGYDLNYYQIPTSFGLSPNLSYVNNTNNRQIANESYFEYLTNRPKVFVPSNIRSIRSKLVPNQVGSVDAALSTRKSVLDIYGLNHFYVYYPNNWSKYNTFNRLDNINTPFTPLPSTFYLDIIDFNTRENTLLVRDSSGFTSHPLTRISTRRWFNRLWAQFVLDSTIKVDVDSYKKVEFQHPTNPTQYIKYTTSSQHSSDEYSFVLTNPQTLETVLTPGVLDVAKQVKMTKPTNVDIDVNLSFLVCLLPFVDVIQKKKEI